MFTVLKAATATNPVGQVVAQPEPWQQHRAQCLTFMSVAKTLGTVVE
jgi:hypothetical protein